MRSSASPYSSDRALHETEMRVGDILALPDRGARRKNPLHRNSIRRISNADE